MAQQILIREFRLEGVTLVSQEQLQAELAQFRDKEYTFAGLGRITNAVTAFYASQGLVARALFPPQDIEDGVIRIRVIEGKLGEVRIDNQGERARTGIIRGFVRHRMEKGEPVDLEALGETLNILNDQPGVTVSSSLGSGDSEGLVNLRVTSRDKPAMTFSASVSNQGSRATGEAQAVASATSHNPSGNFDLGTLLYSKTEGSNFLLADYSRAVGYSGLRLGGNLSRLDYEVTQDSLRGSGSRGDAGTLGLNAYYPLYRLRLFSLALTGLVERKNLEDFTFAGEVGDRVVMTSGLGFTTSAQDDFLSGGLTSLNATFFYGDSDQRNDSARLQDATTRQAFSDFTKITYALRRQQQLVPLWILDIDLRGQFAFDNLDSSERFSLGGVNGVRAYPSGEAGGDEGHILSVNLVKQFPGSVTATLFADSGYIRDNHELWAGWNAADPDQENTYRLSGYGTSLDWAISSHFSLSAIVAKPIGNNPGRDATGNDSDGRNQDLRGWVSLVSQF
ncbi:MAG: POTRA domain-containing protein [Oleiphilaceae bacterium]|nr:POTRA domain-containing protein [Oleiphilaceae bacterium]